MVQRVHLLTLIVDASGAIERMKLEETDGASTEFTFTQIEEDIPLLEISSFLGYPESLPGALFQSGKTAQ